MLDAFALRRDRLRRHGMWLVWGTVTIGVAVLIGAALVPRRGASLRETLLAAGRFRPTPGRLIPEVAHRAWRAPVAGGSWEPAIVEALGREPIEDADLLDRAVIDLLRGDFERAIARLELASHAAPTAHEALTALSAAYLARFEAEHDCLDLLRSVQAADRGLSTQPQSAGRCTSIARWRCRGWARGCWRRRRGGKSRAEVKGTAGSGKRG